MTELTFDQLKSITSPYGNADILKNTTSSFNKFAEEFGLTTDLRKAHFLAQIAHESDHFKTTVEYGGSKTRYAPWYGRGLIQTTWEQNYTDFYKWCVKRGISNVPEFAKGTNREAVAQFPWAFLCAVWYWETRNLNELADQDLVRVITKKINGGYNGLADRIEFLNKAKKIFRLKTVDVDVAPGSIVGGKFGVADIQRALVKKGVRTDIDGHMGPATLAAIKAFQQTNGLVPDGVIGAKTQEKLFS
jgi:putative chitinase